MNCYKRLPFESMDNARDLGGYPCKDGMTKYGVFIRSELPGIPSENDKSLIKKYGITMNIDFRSAMEIERSPDPLAELPGLTYVHMPMFDEFAVRGSEAASKSLKEIKQDFRWDRQYVFMAESHKDWFKKVLEKMDSAEGAVMYHCTTGKDRTGLISAALLSICGVADIDIIADYAVSQIYLEKMYSLMAAMYPDQAGKMNRNDPFMSTAPENMEGFIGHINKTYGSMTDFLGSCGVADATIASLRLKLLTK